MSISVRSWNQLCALAKPLTAFVIARGLPSCTIQSHGGSSTSASWAFLSSVSISFGLFDAAIFANAASKVSFFQWPQLEPLGAKLNATNQRPICETSDDTRLMFIA